VAQTRLSPGGKIFVHGELWNAIADKTIVKGAVVQVIGVEDLVARVKKADN
jgi:membrane-bound serine protease (ClpP class)